MTEQELGERLPDHDRHRALPSFADWVRCIRPEPWMGRAQPIHKLVDPFAQPDRKAA